MKYNFFPVSRYFCIALLNLNTINVPVKQSILDAMEHLLAKKREIRPLLDAPARPAKKKHINIPSETLIYY